MVLCTQSEEHLTHGGDLEATCGQMVTVTLSADELLWRAWRAGPGDVRTELPAASTFREQWRKINQPMRQERSSQGGDRETTAARGKGFTEEVVDRV